MKDKLICFLYLLVAGKFMPAAAQQKDTLPYTEKYRPQYHLTSPKGALFDPTALVYVNGLYQVNRRLAVSNDLIHWQLGNRQRLNTDSTREMSGSVVIDDKNSSGFGIAGKPPLVAVYSALRNKDGRQFQCIAYSNDEGKTWIQYDSNPVIDIGSNEFRDPQVFWHPQTKKWIMVVAMAAEQKVRFYNSADLKNWTYLSEFGKVGAVKGVWECPDLFPLPVDGNKQNIKWILEVSVQPIGGQYFVGEFDGKKFSMDSDFNAGLSELKKNEPVAEGDVLFDFENDLTGWQKEGDAFSASPSKGALEYQNAVIGYKGNKLINSFYNRDAARGKITSPSFVINKKYINFLIGGGDHPGETCINLIVDNKIVRSATGVNTEVLYWANWDVEPYSGKKAHIEIVDNFSGGFGHILIDQVMLSDKPVKNEKEATTWIDYGPDYYAGRSWVNAPGGRRISVAWLGSWLYATSVPTNPWKGGHTFPRELQLKTFPEGLKLIQNPVNEIQTIRDKHFHVENILIDTSSVFNKFNVSDNAYELQAEFEVENAGIFGLDLCKGRGKKITLTYDVKNESLSLDRSISGDTSFSVSFPHSYKAPLKPRNKRIKLNILIDHSSIEVFGNEGEVAITCQVFPDPGNKGIDIFSVNNTVKLINLDLWKLNSIWKNQ